MSGPLSQGGSTASTNDGALTIYCHATWQMVLIDERIAQARQNVESGQRIIAGQQKLIAMLKEQKRSTLFAESLLKSFESSQEIFEADLTTLEG